METFTSWDDSLLHYGVLGMKWGVRRYQNEDGTLTSAGQKRYEKSGTGDSVFLRTSSRTTRGLKRRLAKDDAREAAGKERKYDKEKMKKALKKSEAFDKKVQKRVSGQSAGKTIAQTLLMGSRGALRYNQLREMGNNRLKSFGVAYVSTLLRANGASVPLNIVNSWQTSRTYKKKKG